MNLIDLDLPGLRGQIGPPPGAAVVGLRPHDVHLDSEHGLLRGTVQLVEPIGAAQIVHVRANETRVLAVAAPQLVFRPGDEAAIGAEPDRLHFFDADGRRL
jgi:ABC-type sugar transport system ATPase subunit